MSQHQFSPRENSHLTPRQWYEQVSAHQGFLPDSAQESAICYLQALYDELMAFRQQRHQTLNRWRRNLAEKTRQHWVAPQIPVPRGLYFWGGVGRGKSFLMDSFFMCLPYQRKRRVHFHAFMQEVHHALKTLRGHADPLPLVAERIAHDYRVICFDEFHVSDIADAMILARLLKLLLARGVVFVMTSNYPPDGLYPNGLHRESFLPAIALLNAQLTVINVDSGVDYRLRNLEKIRVYLHPLTSTTDNELTSAFERLADGVILDPDVTIEGRALRAIRHSSQVVWFDFHTLCETARGQADYLYLAENYNTVILSNIPAMSADMASPARRFTWLVDVFYDHRVKLIISAAVPAESLYLQGTHANEFFRTVSRLQEMQSKEYLSLAHASGLS